MNAHENHVFRFGPYSLDASSRQLLRAGELVGLKPKVLDALLFFVHHPGELLTKQQLMEALWPDSIVEEANLTQTVSMLRRALGGQRDGERYIVTVPKRGYQFVCPVENGGRLEPGGAVRRTSFRTRALA